MEPEVLSTKRTKARAGPTEATKRHGLILPGFFDPAICDRIRSAMDAGVPEPAEILAAGFEIDDDVRRAAHVEVDAGTLRLVEQRLDEARNGIGRALGTELDGREGAGFLRYQPGGFFRRHRDRGDVPSWPGASRRRVSVVVFLNSSKDAEATGAFSGGALTLYPENEATAGVDLHPRAGTLVAFPSTLLHEVTPVHGGVRDAIVDWFY